LTRYFIERYAARFGGLQRVWRELTIVGARVYQRDDFVAAIDLLSSGGIPADPLITDIIPLWHAQRALTELEGGGAMKILIEVANGG
jgi:(R,R)-butanediol dehydrogenase / meso-butanediol dehydrogenase / diacetyl reductase